MRSWIILFFAAFLFACNTTPEYETMDGTLEVPENRSNPNSRKLQLVYKVLKAKYPDSTKAPIVYLQGGPGASTLIMEAFWKDHPLRNDRDIVLMDQRGTGKSGAYCIELGAASFALLRQDLKPEDQIRAVEALLSECKKTMKKDRVDLAGYNSRENAADFEDLRKVLGYDKWNLFGASYGTRLGLTIMRDFPNSVRSSVLAGVLAPETNFLNESNKNFENSLFSVLDRCEKNEECNSRYPNIKERLLNIVKKLQTEPLRFEYKGKLLVLNAIDVFLLPYVSLYDRNSIGDIPLLIEALENGEPQLLRNAINGVENLYKHLNWPMNYSVMVYEELPFYNAAAMKESLKHSKIIGFDPSLSIESVANWHSFRSSDLENQPVVSEIPTLLVSGGLDHATPASNAKEALRHLKNGYEIIFHDDGHNLFNSCFFEIAADFLNDPFQKPNSDCSIKSKPIEWNLSNPLQ